ncbi:fungal-specific transcription factor domain-containing protein [Mycena filopes]|nr:fungal-specific transcription factor domain-containing protein [Mycena filopes]
MTLDNSSKPNPRQRKIACDLCKRRKIRCDGDQNPGARCSQCEAARVDCSLADIVRSSAPAKEYVAALESRVEKMERLLTKLLPGIDFTAQLENQREVHPIQPRSEILPRNDDNGSETPVNYRLPGRSNQFFGKSSNLQLVQTALIFHGCIFGIPEIASMLPKRPEFWRDSWPISHNPRTHDDNDLRYTYPDPDLLLSLVSLYFQEVNPYWPVLHRPSFERKLANQLHLYDPKFGATLLAVCSLGARHSDDPRICLDGAHIHTAGWRWLSQVRTLPEHLMSYSDLYELQTLALTALYFYVISPTTLAWDHVGLGLRRAQDLGVHRRRTGLPTAENEEWKRVFWVLLGLEWVLGAVGGRPISLHADDFDQDLPIDCDDEYWDIPGPHRFKQPQDKPSSLAYFISFMKLLEIQATVLTTLYSSKPPKDHFGDSSPPTDAQYIMRLDSSLNAWLSILPDQLRWDSGCRNRLLLTQSGVLHAAFSSIQILIHRPYIPFASPKSTTVPSLALCTTAARKSVQILEVVIRHGSPLNFNLLAPVFTAAGILICNVWISGNTASASITSKDMDQFYTCRKYLSQVEKRYLGVGRYSDLLNCLLYRINGDSLDSILGLEALRVAPPSAQLDVCDNRSTQVYSCDRREAFEYSELWEPSMTELQRATTESWSATSFTSHPDDWLYMRQEH